MVYVTNYNKSDYVGTRLFVVVLQHLNNMLPPLEFVTGALVVLGRDHKFRFNHPAEAAILRQRRSVSFEVFTLLFFCKNK